MAVVKQDADLDFGGVGKLIRALMNPVASDPGTPVDGEFWYRTDTDVFRFRANGITYTVATTADVSAGGISASAYDAQTVLIAVADNTPVAQTLAASTVLGRRATGDITAVSYANLKTDLEALGLAATSLGGSSLASVLSRANHTGSQSASTISDFTTAVNALVSAGISAAIDGAPGTLDTLNELAAALGDDANFATTVNTALGLRTRKFSGNYGNGTLTSFTVNHALASTDVVVSVRLNSDGSQVQAQVVHTDANNVTVSVNTVYASNALRIVVIG